ncbi:MAG: GNAT family N-acetyltransferase [Tranquillimonas sp.]
MTPDDLARLHAAAFDMPPPWPARAFEQLLALPGTFLIARDGAFALGRVVLDESELLTLAVAPPLRRRGLGRTCLIAYEQGARQRGATLSHLEVAADNGPAIALYGARGYRQTGRRPGYYRGADGRPRDAVLMARGLIAR